MIPIKTIRESFSTRLSLQIVMIAFVVFMAVFAVVLFSSKSIVQQEAESHAGSELSGTVYQIEDILHQVEVAAKNMEWMVNEHINTPDTLYAVTRMMIKSNPHIIGSCVAFEPWFYTEKGELCHVNLLARVAQRTGKDVRCFDGGYFLGPFERTGKWHETLSPFLYIDDQSPG